MKLFSGDRFRVIAGCAVIVLTIGVAFGLGFARSILTVEGGSSRAEVLVVLGGDLGDRGARALELYRSNAAPRILITGMDDCYFIRDFLVLSGVASNCIIIESAARSTQENADFSVRLMRQEGMRSAILVTSWYHSRRALGSFRRYAAGIDLASYPAQPRAEVSDGRGYEGTRRVLREYLALGWYWVRYGIVPFHPLPPP